MLECGDKIGDYTLARFLGRGQFGEVWLAEKELQFSTRKVQHALKFLFNLGEEINLKSAEAEIDTWIEASGHPNVMSVLDMLVHKDHVVIASEYAEGGSLKNWMKGFGGRAPSHETALKMMTGILSGIEHLHSRNVVHRDLKPDNILLQGNFPRITDFGISRIISAGSMSTVAMGSPFYMSPESFDGSKSTQTDIWSAGVILYEMLTGEHPYRADTIYGLVSSIRQDAPAPLPNAIPKALRKIVETALQKDLSKRFATAKAMRSTIELEIHNLKVRTDSRSRFSVDSTSETLEDVDLPNENDIRVGKSPKETHETNVRKTGGKKNTGLNSVEKKSETEESQETLVPLGWSQKTLTAEVDNVKILPGVESASKVQIARPNEPLNVPAYMYADRGFGNSQPTPRNRPLLWIVALGGVTAIGLVLVMFVIIGVTKTFFWNRSNANTVLGSDPPITESTASELNVPDGMKYIPGGKFRMGRDNGELGEKPSHEVTVKPFYMDIYEVTNADYAKFLNEFGKLPPKAWKKEVPQGNLPLVGIDWNDAQEYANWAKKRLPTEEEWEFAVRGKNDLLYPWGNEWDPTNANISSRGLKPVGSYCVSPFGLCDLIGNAWEWTASDFKNYDGSTAATNKKGDQKTIRGNSFIGTKKFATATFRIGLAATGAPDYSKTGFRCVMDAK